MRIDKLVNTASSETWNITKAKCEFTLENLRILLILRAFSANNYYTGRVCSAPLEVYSELFDISKEQTVLDFKKAMEELLTLAITPRVEHTIIGWLSSYEFIDQGKVKFYWNPEVSRLAEEGSAFGPFRLYHLKGLSSVLALKLFRFLNPLAVYKQHCGYTEVLADFLNLEDFTGNAKELKQLLLPAVDEINKSTTLTISSITNMGKGLKFKMQRKSYVKK